jgi:pimeloyl-ACP methyl ester carboxylesterase
LTAEKIPDSELIVMGQTGHLSNFDAPEAFNKHVLEFLEKVERRQGR